MKISIEYLKHTLPVPLVEVCKLLEWDVYVDFDIDRILISKNEASNIYVYMAWEKGIPIYLFCKTYVEEYHKGRFNVYFKQAPNCTRDIKEVIKVLSKEIDPFED